MNGDMGRGPSFRVQAAAILLVMAAFLGGGFFAAYEVGGNIQGLIRATTLARLQSAAALDVLAMLQQAESGERGFLLTGEAEYLGPYRVASSRMAGLIAGIEARAALLPGHGGLAAGLAEAAQAKMEELRGTVALAERGDLVAARAAGMAEAGRLSMAAARDAAVRIVELAEQDRASRATLLRDRQSLVTELMLGALVGAVLLLGAVAIRLLYSQSRLRVAQRAERLQAVLLQAAVEHVPDGVGVFDGSGRLSLVNARLGPMLGLGPNQVGTGAALAGIAAAAGLEPGLLDGGRPASACSGEARQGGRTLEVWRSPLPDGGQIVAVADLTRRVAAEEVARQAQKMDVLGQMTGGVAHDFNNLLQVVSANLELARSRVEAGEGGAAVVARLRAASAGVARGARLTRHLLAFARRQPLTPVALDPVRLLRGMEDVLRRTVGGSVEVRLELQPGLRAMRADPTQFENAVLNLALNARDAMTPGDGPPRGRLLVRAENVEVGRRGGGGWGGFGGVGGEFGGRVGVGVGARGLCVVRGDG